MNGQDLAAAVGVRPTMLYEWNRAGYLCPEYRVTDEGKVCVYSDTDVAVARKMAGLVQVGLTSRVAYLVVSGDREMTAALVAAIDGVDRVPVLEPMRRAEAAADRAVWDAQDIAVAVRDVDPRDLWPELEAMRAGEPHRLLSAVVALAAMVPVDRPVRELLSWTESFLDEQGAA